MSKNRKPIPPPATLQPQHTGSVPFEERYPLPFVLAEGPRMMLNFLALHSGIPDAYRRVIAQWLLVHNTTLGEYLVSHHGIDGAEDASSIAESMAAGFLKVIAEEREASDRDMFETLDREVFGGNDGP